jgi:hypothetical protein
MENGEDLKEKRKSVRGWLIIGAMVVLFLFYGFVMYLFVGDKGPPAWDFGVVEDIPGESSYSTHRPRQGKGSEPEPQHVSEKPSQAGVEGKKEKP